MHCAKGREKDDFMQRPFMRPQILWRAGVVVLLATTVVIAFFADPDPTYGAIRLSEILREKRLWGPQVRSSSSFTPREEECVRALHGMGEPAMAILLKEVRSKDSRSRSWLIKFARTHPFVPVKLATDAERQMAARMAILELILPSYQRSDEQDRTWRGIEEFEPKVRERIALDLAAALRADFKDPWSSGLICNFLLHVGTNATAAIPVLEEAVRAGSYGAREALTRVRGLPDEDPKW